MPIQYKIVKTVEPGKKGGENGTYRPSIYNRHLVNTKDIIELLAKRNRIPKPDIIRVLYSLSEAVTELLLDNNNVEIPDLGILSLTIQGLNVTDPKEIKSDKIKKLNVAFRASKALKEELKKATFQKGKVT